MPFLSNFRWVPPTFHLVSVTSRLHLSFHNPINIIQIQCRHSLAITSFTFYHPTLQINQSFRLPSRFIATNMLPKWNRVPQCDNRFLVKTLVLQLLSLSSSQTSKKIINEMVTEYISTPHSTPPQKMEATSGNQNTKHSQSSQKNSHSTKNRLHLWQKIILFI